ncbi:MAG: hypothetical protein ACI9W4_001605, partial [Rhodothermales bacterium]
EKAEDAVSGSDDEAASDQAEGADVDKKA